jgi:hypothetical protein
MQANSLQDPISKITRAKWTAGVAQAVEHLLCKCKALSSNHIPPKEGRKKGRKEGKKEKEEKASQNSCPLYPLEE